ncbi:unnamed protein product [Gongylonema pulchrum]|uniref:BZIP domain-containing protein n=1 Tax=Gongylonema pulchrum TaxID=637853 RepID=A0A3P7M237_9BILA|nr:unnamed protein product [Gongylonema pulchrum]
MVMKSLEFDLHAATAADDFSAFGCELFSSPAPSCNDDSEMCCSSSSTTEEQQQQQTLAESTGQQSSSSSCDSGISWFFPDLHRSNTDPGEFAAYVDDPVSNSDYPPPPDSGPAPDPGCLAPNEQQQQQTLAESTGQQSSSSSCDSGISWFFPDLHRSNTDPGQFAACVDDPVSNSDCPHPRDSGLAPDPGCLAPNIVTSGGGGGGCASANNNSAQPILCILTSPAMPTAIPPTVHCGIGDGQHTTTGMSTRNDYQELDRKKEDRKMRNRYFAQISRIRKKKVNETLRASSTKQIATHHFGTSRATIAGAACFFALISLSFFSSR